MGKIAQKNGRVRREFNVFAARFTVKGAFVKGKTYLRLFHGRNEPDEQLDGWGFDGPVLGPISSFHVTYGGATMRVSFEQLEEGMFLPFEKDLLVCEGKYYGDFCLFVAE